MSNSCLICKNDDIPFNSGCICTTCGYKLCHDCTISYFSDYTKLNYDGTPSNHICLKCPNCRQLYAHYTKIGKTHKLMQSMHGDAYETIYNYDGNDNDNDNDSDDSYDDDVNGIGSGVALALATATANDAVVIQNEIDGGNNINNIDDGGDIYGIRAAIRQNEIDVKHCCTINRKPNPDRSIQMMDRIKGGRMDFYRQNKGFTNIMNILYTYLFSMKIFHFIPSIYTIINDIEYYHMDKENLIKYLRSTDFKLKYRTLVSRIKQCPDC
jgi:hypothetical protein